MISAAAAAAAAASAAAASSAAAPSPAVTAPSPAAAAPSPAAAAPSPAVTAPSPAAAAPSPAAAASSAQAAAASSAQAVVASAQAAAAATEHAKTASVQSPREETKEHAPAPAKKRGNKTAATKKRDNPCAGTTEHPSDANTQAPPPPDHYLVLLNDLNSITQGDAVGVLCAVAAFICACISAPTTPAHMQPFLRAVSSQRPLMELFEDVADALNRPFKHVTDTAWAISALEKEVGITVEGSLKDPEVTVTISYVQIMLLSLTKANIHNERFHGQLHTCTFHAESLLQHLVDASLVVVAHYNDNMGSDPDGVHRRRHFLAAVAAAIHDIGKPASRAFVQRASDKTLATSFPQHAFISATSAVCAFTGGWGICRTLDEEHAIVDAIAHHMCGYHSVSNPSNPYTFVKRVLLRNLEEGDTKAVLHLLGVGDGIARVDSRWPELRAPDAFVENILRTMGKFADDIRPSLCDACPPYATGAAYVAATLGTTDPFICMLGTSGTGKTTAARALIPALQEATGRPVQHLQRDEAMLTIARVIATLHKLPMPVTYAQAHDLTHSRVEYRQTIDGLLNTWILKALRTGDTLIVDTVKAMYVNFAMDFPDTMDHFLRIGVSTTRNVVIDESCAARWGLTMKRQKELTGPMSPENPSRQVSIALAAESATPVTASLSSFHFLCLTGFGPRGPWGMEKAQAYITRLLRAFGSSSSSAAATEEAEVDHLPLVPSTLGSVPILAMRDPGYGSDPVMQQSLSTFLNRVWGLCSRGNVSVGDSVEILREYLKVRGYEVSVMRFCQDRVIFQVRYILGDQHLCKSHRWMTEARGAIFVVTNEVHAHALTGDRASSCRVRLLRGVLPRGVEAALPQHIEQGCATENMNGLGIAGLSPRLQHAIRAMLNQKNGDGHCVLSGKVDGTCTLVTVMRDPVLASLLVHPGATDEEGSHEWRVFAARLHRDIVHPMYGPEMVVGLGTLVYLCATDFTMDSLLTSIVVAMGAASMGELRACSSIVDLFFERCASSFVETVVGMAQRSTVGNASRGWSMEQGVSLMFESVPERTMDASGRLRGELTQGYATANFLFLAVCGLVNGESDVQPHFHPRVEGVNRTFSEPPAFLLASNRVDEVLRHMSDILMSDAANPAAEFYEWMKVVQQFPCLNGPRVDWSIVHMEGFVVYTLFVDARGHLETSYSKAKTPQYYPAHKFAVEDMMQLINMSRFRVARETFSTVASLHAFLQGVPAMMLDAARVLVQEMNDGGSLRRHLLDDVLPESRRAMRIAFARRGRPMNHLAAAFQKVHVLTPVLWKGRPTPLMETSPIMKRVFGGVTRVMIPASMGNTKSGRQLAQDVRRAHGSMEMLMMSSSAMRRVARALVSLAKSAWDQLVETRFGGVEGVAEADLSEALIDDGVSRTVFGVRLSSAFDLPDMSLADVAEMERLKMHLLVCGVNIPTLRSTGDVGEEKEVDDDVNVDVDLDAAAGEAAEGEAEAAAASEDVMTPAVLAHTRRTLEGDPLVLLFVDPRVSRQWSLAENKRSGRDVGGEASRAIAVDDTQAMLSRYMELYRRWRVLDSLSRVMRMNSNFHAITC
jgi:hypothetical protein